MSTETDRLKSLIKTRQYRHFMDKPVAVDDLAALAEVARWSGSSTNSQPWRFIITRDVAVLRYIAQLGLPQTRALQTAMAALAITLPDDPARLVSYAYDDGRVAERVLIGAELLGLGAGITWVRPEVRQEIGTLIGVAEGRFVRTIMAIGHLAAEDRAPKAAPGQARLPLDELLDWR